MEYQKVPPFKTILALALTLIPIDVVSFLYGFRPVCMCIRVLHQGMYGLMFIDMERDDIV